MSSSNLSKLPVSISLASSGMKGADCLRRPSQFIPSKKGWDLISWMPRVPNLLSESQIRCLMRSVAAGERLASPGIISVFFQCMIFWHVIEGSSEKKGGYPTSISYRITPTDHQSTVSVYPFCPKTSGAM